MSMIRSSGMQAVKFQGISLTASTATATEKINIADNTELTIQSVNGGRFWLSTTDPTYVNQFPTAYTELQIHQVDGRTKLNVVDSEIVVERLEDQALIIAKNNSVVTIGAQEMSGGQLKADVLSKFIFKNVALSSDGIPDIVTIQHAEDNPYLAQIYQFNRIADKLELPQSVREVLSTPYRELSVQIPIEMDDGTLKTFYGYRVQHNGALGPYKGGIRYAPNVDLDEVRSLAAGMTWKNSLAGLNYGGAKGGIICDPTKMSKSELKRLTERYTRQLGEFIGPNRDVPAPDMGTNAETMTWMMETYSEEHGHTPEVVTGKPVDPYGSVGRAEATSQGAFYVLEQLLADRDEEVKGKTIAVQGFGKVGYHFARIADEAGAKIQAISTIDGALYNKKGLDIADVKQYLDDGGDINKYTKNGSKMISNDALLELEVDVLAPAAAGEVITAKNADKIKAKMILECANHPVTPMADETLAKMGVEVIPDVLVNAGGVIVSYFEWEQNKQGAKWKLEEVNSKLKEKMVDNYIKVRDVAKKEGTNFRDAAWLQAVSRVAKASKYTRDHLLTS